LVEIFWIQQKTATVGDAYLGENNFIFPWGKSGEKRNSQKQQLYINAKPQKLH
jgi:hypothetical protein